MEQESAYDRIVRENAGKTCQVIKMFSPALTPEQTALVALWLEDAIIVQTARNRLKGAKIS